MVLCMSSPASQHTAVASYPSHQTGVDLWQPECGSSTITNAAAATDNLTTSTSITENHRFDEEVFESTPKLLETQITDEEVAEMASFLLQCDSDFMGSLNGSLATDIITDLPPRLIEPQSPPVAPPVRAGKRQREDEYNYGGIIIQSCDVKIADMVIPGTERSSLGCLLESSEFQMETRDANAAVVTATASEATAAAAPVLLVKKESDCEADPRGEIDGNVDVDVSVPTPTVADGGRDTRVARRLNRCEPIELILPKVPPKPLLHMPLLSCSATWQAARSGGEAEAKRFKSRAGPEYSPPRKQPCCAPSQAPPSCDPVCVRTSRAPSSLRNCSSTRNCAPSCGKRPACRGDMAGPGEVCNNYPTLARLNAELELKPLEVSRKWGPAGGDVARPHQHAQAQREMAGERSGVATGVAAEEGGIASRSRSSDDGSGGSVLPSRRCSTRPRRSAASARGGGGGGGVTSSKGTHASRCGAKVGAGDSPAPAPRPTYSALRFGEPGYPADYRGAFRDNVKAMAADVMQREPEGVEGHPTWSVLLTVTRAEAYSAPSLQLAELLSPSASASALTPPTPPATPRLQAPRGAAQAEPATDATGNACAGLAEPAMLYAGAAAAHPSQQVLLPLLLVAEETVGSANPHCDYCRSSGWCHHPIASHKYHFIIPVKNPHSHPRAESQFLSTTANGISPRGTRSSTTTTSHDPSSPTHLTTTHSTHHSSHHSSITATACRGLSLASPSHLLHGVIHSNGFGHLLAVNGRAAGSHVLSGKQLVQLWDNICGTLRARVVSVEDLSHKLSFSSHYRLLHTAAFRRPWFALWGYSFAHGAFGVTQERYSRAAGRVAGTRLPPLLQHLRGVNTGIASRVAAVIAKYPPHVLAKCQSRELVKCQHQTGTDQPHAAASVVPNLTLQELFSSLLAFRSSLPLPLHHQHHHFPHLLHLSSLPPPLSPTTPAVTATPTLSSPSSSRSPLLSFSARRLAPPPPLTLPPLFPPLQPITVRQLSGEPSPSSASCLSDDLSPRQHLVYQQQQQQQQLALPSPVPPMSCRHLGVLTPAASPSSAAAAAAATAAAASITSPAAACQRREISSEPIIISPLPADSPSCRWSAKRLSLAQQVIVDILSLRLGHWLPRHEVREAARQRIGDTGLLDFVLKSLGNRLVGEVVVRRAINPLSKVLEFRLERLRPEGGEAGTGKEAEGGGDGEATEGMGWGGQEGSGGAEGAGGKEVGVLALEASGRELVPLKGKRERSPEYCFSRRVSCLGGSSRKAETLGVAGAAGAEAAAVASPVVVTSAPITRADVTRDVEFLYKHLLFTVTSAHGHKHGHHHSQQQQQSRQHQRHPQQQQQQLAQGEGPLHSTDFSLSAFAEAVQTVLDTKQFFKDYKGELTREEAARAAAASESGSGGYGAGGGAEGKEDDDDALELEGGGEDGTIRVLCNIDARDADTSRAWPIPPPELVTLPPDATVADLKAAACRAFAQTYPVARHVQLQGSPPELSDLDEDDLLFGTLDSGTSLLFPLAPGSLDPRSDWRYEGGSDSWVVLCACGATDDDGERMIACDKCGVWQHTRCAGIGDAAPAPMKFLCLKCSVCAAVGCKEEKAEEQQRQQEQQQQQQCYAVPQPLFLPSSTLPLALSHAGSVTKQSKGDVGDRKGEGERLNVGRKRRGGEEERGCREGFWGALDGLREKRARRMGKGKGEGEGDAQSG